MQHLHETISMFIIKTTTNWKGDINVGKSCLLDYWLVI